MSEKKAIYILNQIQEHLDRTGQLDNERRNALELSMKSLNGSAEFQMKKFVESMMKLSEKTNSDEITYRWRMKDGQKIVLCFTVFQNDDEEC